MGTDIPVVINSGSPIRDGKLEINPTDVCGFANKLYLEGKNLRCEVVMLSHGKSLHSGVSFEDYGLISQIVVWLVQLKKLIGSRSIQLG
jgi:hypothetical protein